MLQVLIARSSCHQFQETNQGVNSGWHNWDHEVDGKVEPLADPRDDVGCTLLGVLEPLGDLVLSPQLIHDYGNTVRIGLKEGQGNHSPIRIQIKEMVRNHYKLPSWKIIPDKKIKCSRMVMAPRDEVGHKVFFAANLPKNWGELFGADNV